jgi:peptidoglycan/xylan/chitin deacetylase (PgdA/CDA1 family)
MVTEVSHRAGFVSRSRLTLAGSVAAGLTVFVAGKALVTTSARVLPADRAAAIALAVLAVLALPRRAGRWLALPASLLVVASVWLISQVRDGAVLVLLGGLTGAGIAVTAAAFAPRDASAPSRRAPIVVAVVAWSVWASAAFWVGANSPRAGWFGSTVSHGPRSGREVALTFDDGPDSTSTLGVQAVLDRFGVKGTFFSVGKAVDARPDISRALVADGQLLADHSYSHDSYRWLDPRYPELARAQKAIARDAGVCPAFYRPPHGQHTPFLALQVHRRGMTMVTWDDSTDDWATTDAAAVARRILEQVQPGSIIDLHDGLDGHVDADRTVLVRALPAILAGLQDRGLQAVRLDVLLNRPGYVGSCPGGQ